MKNAIRLATAAAMLTAGAAFAAPTFTVPGGQALDPFGAIDWSSAGTAYTTNFNQAAANAGTPFNFNTTFFAFAVPYVGIQNNAGVGFTVPNLIATTNPNLAPGLPPFELTTVANFNETGNCQVGGTDCLFNITGGTFSIYLDLSPDAQLGGGAQLSQYNDGILLIQGTVTSGNSNFTSTTGGGNGNVSVLGRVDFTNSTYINPALVGTTATATLQIGNFNTGWQRPTQIVGGADTCGTAVGDAARSCSVAFQADANQAFQIGKVPEPGTLALLGIAMTGLGLGVRRRKSAK